MKCMAHYNHHNNFSLAYVSALVTDMKVRMIAAESWVEELQMESDGTHCAVL